jgi:hypothetical protein
MKRKHDARLSETEFVRDRSYEAEDLELQRLDIVCEIEKLMAEYANESGISKLKERKHKIGNAPNDWNKKKHL